MTYEVFVTPGARNRIREQAEWIATEQDAPQRAVEWLQRVYDLIQGLETMPRRYAVAPEDAWCDFEVRAIAIGQFVLFFTIVEEDQAVWVMHARHGRQLSRAEDFGGWQPPGKGEC